MRRSQRTSAGGGPSMVMDTMFSPRTMMNPSGRRSSRSTCPAFFDLTCAAE